MPRRALDIVTSGSALDKRPVVHIQGSGVSIASCAFRPDRGSCGLLQCKVVVNTGRTADDFTI